MEGLRVGEAALYGSRASSVITHGEIEVPKDLPFIGPKGTISKPCISRANING